MAQGQWYTDAVTWAADAMSWAAGKGILEGDQASRLNPQATASRAEAAAMLMRFCGYVAE